MQKRNRFMRKLRIHASTAKKRYSVVGSSRETCKEHEITTYMWEKQKKGGWKHFDFCVQFTTMWLHTFNLFRIPFEPVSLPLSFQVSMFSFFTSSAPTSSRSLQHCCNRIVLLLHLLHLSPSFLFSLCLLLGPWTRPAVVYVRGRQVLCSNLSSMSDAAACTMITEIFDCQLSDSSSKAATEATEEGPEELIKEICRQLSVL